MYSLSIYPSAPLHPGRRRVLGEVGGEPGREGSLHCRLCRPEQPWARPHATGGPNPRAHPAARAPRPPRPPSVLPRAAPHARPRPPPPPRPRPRPQRAASHRAPGRLDLAGRGTWGGGAAGGRRRGASGEAGAGRAGAGPRWRAAARTCSPSRPCSSCSGSRAPPLGPPSPSLCRALLATLAASFEYNC